MMRLAPFHRCVDRHGTRQDGISFVKQQEQPTTRLKTKSDWLPLLDTQSTSESNPLPQKPCVTVSMGKTTEMLKCGHVIIRTKRGLYGTCQDVSRKPAQCRLPETSFSTTVTHSCFS